MTSIRSTLAWLVAGCLLPAIVIIAALLYYTYQEQRAELLRESVSSARALMSSIDREFDGTQATLRALATSPSLGNQNYAAFHAQAKEVLSGHYANNIVLIDASGQQLLNTASPYGQVLPKVTNTTQLARVLASGLPDVSNLFMGPVLKKPLINVAIPIRSGGTATVTHSLVGVVLPAYLQKILTDHQLPSNRIGVIFDASGAVVARTQEIDLFLGKPVAKELLKRIKEVDEDALELVSLEGILMMTAFSRSAGSHWAVAIGVPVDVMMADQRQAFWLLVGLATLLMASSLGLAWLLGARISGAIHQLMQPAQNLALGKVVKVPELAIKEADELGRTLMMTSVLLESTNSALNSALTNIETRMRGILESAMDAIITVDDRQNIVLFNAAAATMFACPVEDAIGTPLTRFIPARFHAQHADFLEKQALTYPHEHAGGLNGVTVGLRLGGNEFPAEISFSSVVELGATFQTLIVRDITERVQAFRALERSNLDLQQFAFVASHDLKTPLRSISGFVQLLQRNHVMQLDDNALALISRTLGATRRLEQLTDDLLSYARVNSETRPFSPTNCDEVVGEVTLLMNAAILSSGAVVTVDDLPTVLGDRTQLVQLFLNLIGNGIKYCPDRAPLIHVSAQKTDREWVFSVADNGIGIDARHHDKIFEVFKRLHTQNEYAGTGIGLAVCRRVVERHGGRIWVKSEIGQGSTFCFTIPDSHDDSE